MNYKNRNNSFVPFNSAGKTAVNKSRRTFLKQSSIAAATTSLASLGIATSRPARATEQSGFNRLSTNSMGFNGHRQDPVSGLYHLGNGYRVYNPGLIRFHAADSMSPFGRGGINSYAYALGDPINLRDPSGHFALFSLLIGAIIGAVIGAVVSAAVEGIRAAATGDEFDFKQVFIGAALGFISGGFGAAAIGAKTGVQVGLAVADAVVSGAADFGLNVAAGSNLRDAGVGAGVGATIGLVTFGLGKGIGTVVNKVSRKLVRQNNRIGFLLSPTGGKSKLASSTGEQRALDASVNRIDQQISGALSSDTTLDFVWVRNVKTSNLTPVTGNYSPNEGSAALLIHSDGANLLIKGDPYSPKSVANKITGLPGYGARQNEALILGACKAGQCGHGSIAQQFADTTRRPVIATEGLVHLNTNNEQSILTSLYSDRPFSKFNPLPLYP
ncbi:RHS repeat-associated core domain-containing protein [Microbulbifer sp. 2201CG32-9]|uniref:RHS repeat-associated core domain-containing protein n=1 Tax=Microbulbifer sp. 2201CG32-9 TaxID=3232309 RepID=UPI00345C0D8A